MAAIAAVAIPALAQLPPIYANVPIALAPAETVAEFPRNTFLESVVVDESGTLFITSYEDGKIHQMRSGSAPEEFAAIAGNVAGLAIAPDNSLLVSGRNAEGVPTMFGVSQTGEVKTLLTMPEAQFLNGITQLAGDRYLVADSYVGAIWEFNTTTNTARIWLQDEMLARATTENPTPAVNGLKIYDGVLYASNTAKAMLLKIPLQANGEPGAIEVFVQPAVIDDFAIDSAGNLYATTHVFNSVLRIAPDGSLTTIAQADQGVTGCTALAFDENQSSLYIVTNGGMTLPPADGVQPAEVVRLSLDSVR
ncbi:MAG: gluconolactonase [Leptolyngbyaceae cyanobacterium SM1_3_5]|nr:gluconolactonase [Leptolyngbyaceae cyanobacterium SM1_3_5]